MNITKNLTSYTINRDARLWKTQMQTMLLKQWLNLPL